MIKLCECSCGKIVKTPGRKYTSGHNPNSRQRGPRPEFSIKLKKRWQNPEYRKKVSRALKKPPNIVCDTCNKPFRKKPSRIALHKHHYCSTECRDKGLTALSNVTCEICGKEFHRSSSDLAVSEHHYCSRACQAESQRGKKRSPESIKKRTRTRRANGTYRRYESQVEAARRSNQRRDYSDPIYRAKLSKALKKAWDDGKLDREKFSLLASERMEKQLASGRFIYKQGSYASTVTGKKEWYHSSWELLRFKTLDAQGISWTKQHGIRIRYKWEGHYRTYVPDILVENKVLEEIKPAKRLKSVAQERAKIEAGKRYCDKHGLIFRLLSSRSSLIEPCELPSHQAKPNISAPSASIP